MTDQRKLEQLKTGSEARTTSSSRTFAAWDRVQSALRLYLSSEGYRRNRQDDGAAEHPPKDSDKDDSGEQPGR